MVAAIAQHPLTQVQRVLGGTLPHLWGRESDAPAVRGAPVRPGLPAEPPALWSPDHRAASQSDPVGTPRGRKRHLQSRRCELPLWALKFVGVYGVTEGFSDKGCVSVCLFLFQERED